MATPWIHFRQTTELENVYSLTKRSFLLKLEFLRVSLIVLAQNLQRLGDDSSDIHESITFFKTIESHGMPDFATV